MNKLIHIGLIGLVAILCLVCSQPTQIEYGTLIVGIRWDTIADSSLSVALAQAERNGITRQQSPVQTKQMRSPDSVQFSKIKFTLQPGNLVFNFNGMQETYTLQAELGIYNLTVEVLNSTGDIVYSTFQNELLIEPNKTREIQLALEIHFSMTAPQFIDRSPMNTNTTGTYVLTWYSISGAEVYTLNEDEDSTFASPGIPYSGQDTTFTVSNKQDGIYYYRVRASSAIGKSHWSAAVAFQVILTPTLSITTDSLSNGVVGVSYSTSVSATGGTTPYTWSISAGTLPDGLTINAATGTISGTPTVTGAFPFTVHVADAGTPPQTATQTLSITINASTLQITTVSLPNITAGTPYSKQLQASGGTPPYTWSEISRSPDPGFAEGIGLDANGLISGATYVGPGTGAIQVRVTDSAVPAATSTHSFAWTIIPGALELLTAYLPEGDAGETYWGYICYRLGTSPLQSPWIISGDLPDGIVLGYEANNYQLTFSGVTTESGVFNFSVTIHDSSVPQKTRTDAYTLTINPSALAITTTALPDGQVGQTYNQTVSAQGGTTPFTWSISAGTLPDGLTINAATGTISGTPSAAGTFTFTVRVADAGSPQQSSIREYSVLINPPTLRITTATLPDITPGVDYGVYIQASGGTPPYSWTETNREPLGLAEGIVFNAEGYLNGITGVNPQSGQITLCVTDSSTPQRNTSKTFYLQVIARNLELLTGYLPDGKVGESYWGYITYNYGTPPMQSPWTISGSIPDELYYDYEASNYQLSISGTPINAGTYNFSVTVYDSSTPQKSRTDSFTLTINP